MWSMSLADEGSLRAHPESRSKDSANDEHYKLEMHDPGALPKNEKDGPRSPT